MKQWTKVLAVVATVGMFVVLVMGATVTNTGSEHGCGRSWPLCHGQFVPQFAVRTFIEFSHRAVVGVESILIIALAAAALMLYWRRRDVRVLSIVMVLFLFLQAGLGAWAVMAPQLAIVLALHFGVSLVAFASVLLTAVVIFEAGSSDPVSVAPALRAAVWGLTGYSYVVVYLGAYVRHTEADLACSGWPLCNGAVLPPLTAGVGTALIHRIAAAVLVIGIAYLVLVTRRIRDLRPDLYRGAWLSLIAVCLQALAGASIGWTNEDLFSTLAHAGMAGLLFASLTYLCLEVVPARERSGEPARRLERQPVAGTLGSS